ncbi:MAG: AraC family transcriptional regulator [Bacteroidetes bacterium]|nr:AraC family transcriptional regulator [Bacteroidota bacterium]
MKITVHHSIADLYHTLGLPVSGEIDFTILSIPAIHPVIPFQSPHLRADYFSFILTKDGSGTYFLDDHQFPFGPESFYFTNPGHVKRYNLDESEQALIIVLSEFFLTEYVHPNIFHEFPFLLAEMAPPATLKKPDFAEFERLYTQIEAEAEKPSAYQQNILGSLILVLLYKMKALFWQNYNPIAEGNTTSRIVQSFKKILESEFRTILQSESPAGILQVRQIADQLNIHPNYLNAVIKSKTGRPVSDWIAKRTVSVAKSLLLNTALTTKEIAFRLGFSEPTHFSRFFKNQTRLSPGEYRSQTRR